MPYNQRLKVSVSKFWHQIGQAVPDKTEKNGMHGIPTKDYHRSCFDCSFCRFKSPSNETNLLSLSSVRAFSRLNVGKRPLSCLMFCNAQKNRLAFNGEAISFY